MWRIYGILFFNDKNHFLNSTLKSFCREQIIDFLNEKGLPYLIPLHLFADYKIMHRINFSK